MNATQTRWRATRTVLLRMAKDQARAERIRAGKEERPDITWQEIADYVGVSHRAAQAWPETGSIAPKNARKLAELWGKDYDDLYHGPRETPDLMGALSPDAVARSLLELHRKLDELLEYAAAQALADGALDEPGSLGEHEEDAPASGATA